MFFLLLFTYVLQEGVDTSKRADIPELRVDVETRQVGSGPMEIKRYYRGDELRLETHTRDEDGTIVYTSQDLYIKGEIVITLAKTKNYHHRSFCAQSPWVMAEVDVDMNGSWDILWFGEGSYVADAFLISDDGFLEPLSSEVLNRANKMAASDADWLFNHLAREKQKKADDSAEKTAPDKS